MNGWKYKLDAEGTKAVAPKDGLEVTGLNNDQLLPEYQLDNLPQRTKGRQNLEIVVVARYLGYIVEGEW